MEELLRSENSERKCFFADYAEIGQSEKYAEVEAKINNEKAVDCIIAYFEKAKKYCVSQGIEFDDMVATLYVGLYYEGESSEYTSDQINEMDPIRDFCGLRIGLAAYSNAETKGLRHSRRNIDSIEKQGFEYIDDETEEFGLGDLCTSFVITYDDFKKELSKRGYEIDEQITNFGGFDALKNRKSLKLKIQKKNLERTNNEGGITMENETLKMEQENRKFTILQRERAIAAAQRARLSSGIIAGTCILGGIASTLLNGIDANQLIAQELNMFASWESFGQYFQTIGPLTTLAYIGAGIYISRCILDSRRLRKLRQEQEDFESSLENNNIGGNANARTRRNFNARQ